MAGETAHWFRARTVFADDRHSFPSTHMGMPVTSVPGNVMPFSEFHMHYTHVKHIYICNLNNNFKQIQKGYTLVLQNFEKKKLKWNERRKYVPCLPI